MSGVPWDWAFAWQILPQLLRGLVVTVEATLIASAIALVLGLALCMLRLARIGCSPISTLTGFVWNCGKCRKATQLLRLIGTVKRTS